MFIKPTWLKKGFCSDKLTALDLFNLIVKDQKTCELKKDLNIKEYTINWTSVTVGKYATSTRDRCISYFTGIVKLQVAINDMLITIYFQNGVVTKSPSYVKVDLDYK